MDNELFEKAPIPKAYFSLAMPVVLSMLVTLVYNMVDTYFIAHTGNTDMVAGVSLTAPVFTVMIALGDIFGLGGSSVISRLFGQHRFADGKRLSAFCFYAAIATGLLILVLGLAFRDPMLALLGATDDTWQYASDFYTLIIVGSPFIIVSMTPSNLLRTEGHAVQSMIGSVAGTAVNIVLNPLFIHGFGWGAAGSAGATVIANICTDAYFVWFTLRHSSNLSIDPRTVIDRARRRLGDSIRAIARLLGRDPGTVSREVERNRNPESGGYEPYRAQQKAADRLKRPKPRKAAEGTRLWDEIAAGLRRHWSPEQIANRLRLDFPDNGDMHASVETIYQAIYLQARGELKQELKRAMRQGRTARRPQGGQGRKPRFREPMAMISERPPEIEDRAVPGHWEGDLITGSRNKSAIGTLVERTTRFTILLHLPDGHDAEHVQQAIIDKMQHLPKLLRNSLTWDQGAELALHKRIGASLDMAVYFCDPHSPWQRGTNENTNGLLRQYFPKGTDLSVYPEDYLDAVAEELNDRPRKTLGFMKPSEKIIELLDAA
ncbi:IS30 family transposase [Bifidobacterium longum]|nr:IS30 family transposase [Bifidobacterium longum]